MDFRYHTKSTSNRINKLDFIKVKNLCSSNDTLKKVKWQPIKQWEISANHLSDKKLIFKIYKQLNLAQEQNKLKMGKGSEHKFFQDNIPDDQQVQEKVLNTPLISQCK